MNYSKYNGRLQLDQDDDIKQCSTICDAIHECYQDLPHSICMEISEFATGIILECEQCEDGDISFLSNVEWNSCSSCDQVSKYWQCTESNCKLSMAFNDDIPCDDGCGNRNDWGICIFYSECGSSYCCNHSDSLGAYCILCGVYHCENCYDIGEFCGGCLTYYCHEHDPWEYDAYIQESSCRECS